MSEIVHWVNSMIFELWMMMEYEPRWSRMTVIWWSIIFWCPSTPFYVSERSKTHASYYLSNASERRDLTDIGNWRPIVFLPVLYKLFARMLYNRISPSLFRVQSAGQHAFTHDIRIEDALLCAELTTEYALEFHGPLWLLSMDLRKAFDIIDHSGIFKIFVVWIWVRDISVCCNYYIRVIKDLSLIVIDLRFSADSNKEMYWAWSSLTAYWIWRSIDRKIDYHLMFCLLLMQFLDLQIPDTHMISFYMRSRWMNSSLWWNHW